jgi:hypothetical protein
MGGVLDSAVTGCDVVSGGGEASDDVCSKGDFIDAGHRGKVGCIGLYIVWIEVTAGRRLLDLRSGNSTLRA